ncbi:hybrid sensor histidine kinase/response regulator transcription factor [Saccharicrinis sp. 156]|uniref:hybrid sensor histidine kinase/response regulator transcription factor n=1 Tax=Saccharicrinis sp. 156 TaxID=3417574 RepID=UPI003D33C78B
MDRYIGALKERFDPKFCNFVEGEHNVMYRNYFLILLIGLLTFSTSCKKKKDKTIHIGFSQCTNQDAWRETMNREMQVAASLYPNIKLTVLNADGITKKQYIQIRQLINMDVDLLIISPNESEPITPIAEEAFDEHIPTIIIDRKISSKKYTAYIGANNYHIGKNVADYLGNLFKDRREILEIRGLDESSPGQERHRGFMDGLKHYPNLEVTESIEGEWLHENAKNLAAPLLNAQKFDIVFGHNDVMAIGAREVTPEDKAANMFFVGIDALPNLGMEKVNENILQASFLYPTGGNLAIELALKILNNEEYDKNNELATSVIDAGNVKVIKLQQQQVLDHQKTIDKQISRMAQQEEDFNDQRSLLNITLTSLVLLVVVAFWLFYYFIRINKKNHELAQKNDAIERQKKELEEKNNQILEMNKEVEEATQAKLSFFTNISHEIRTPLTLIQASVNTMMDQFRQLHLPTSLIKNLELIHRNSDRLLRIINQLMDFRKVELGKAGLSVSKINIVDDCENIYQSFIPLAKQKEINFSFDKDENRCDIWIDQDKIDKVLFNLLSNAFKFTPQNGVIVIRLKTNFPDHVYVEVSDSGPGIPEEKMKTVFEPFVQQNEHRSMGTGIGLSLSKGFVELHHGKIEINTSKEGGSIFKVTLPKGKEHFKEDQIIPIREQEKTRSYDINSKNIQDSEPLISGESHKEHTVLVVEDDMELKQYLINLLNEHYYVKSAENGKQALEMIELENPDMIVTDLMMPEMDGLEMTQRIKSGLDTCHLPLIMLTAKSTQEQKIEGIETGADAYIEKPFSPEYLLVRIRRLLESRKTLQEYYQQHIVSPKIANHNGQNSLDKKFLSGLIRNLESNYSNANFSVEEFGQQLGLSRIHLYRKVKALTGFTPSEYINKYRLRKSKEFLLNQETNISGVAMEVGFSSSAYFTKKFKEEFGVTPSQYLNESSVGSSH